MDSNVIYKQFFHDVALSQSRLKYNQPIDNLFKNFNPFRLFNILGSNRLFIFFMVMVIIYAWFIRANITLGAIFGFLFLGFLYYLYFQYLYYDIKDYSVDKQQKEQFLANLLTSNEYSPIEGTVLTSSNYLNLSDFNRRNYLYLNPAIVDFYYGAKSLVDIGFLNFSLSLQHANAMILLLREIKIGLENRGNQLTTLEYLRKQCLNYWQALIYKLPSTTATYRKYQNSLDLLEELTQKIIDEAETKIEKQNIQQGINIEYYPIYKGGPKPNDVGTFGFNKNFDFF